MSTYNILTFNQPKYVSSYVTYSESLKTSAWERIFSVWKCLPLKNLSYQTDFQALLCKHHGAVLSNFLRVTKCFQLLMIFWESKEVAYLQEELRLLKNEVQTNFISLHACSYF